MFPSLVFPSRDALQYRLHSDQVFVLHGVDLQGMSLLNLHLAQCSGWSFPHWGDVHPHVLFILIVHIP